MSKIQERRSRRVRVISTVWERHPGPSHSQPTEDDGNIKLSAAYKKVCGDAFEFITGKQWEEEEERMDELDENDEGELEQYIKEKHGMTKDELLKSCSKIQGLIEKYGEEHVNKAWDEIYKKMNEEKTETSS